MILSSCINVRVLAGIVISLSVIIFIAKPNDCSCHSSARARFTPGCGYGYDDKDEDLMQRIAHGHLVSPGQFPYQVLLLAKKPNSRFNALCGGVIISDRHILTAAHCLSQRKSGMFFDLHTIIAGEFNITDPTDGQQMLSAEYYKVHPMFLNSYTVAIDDIALIKTRETIRFNITEDGFGSINRICLPKADTKYTNVTSLLVSGWGRDEANEKSRVLKVARMSGIVDEDEYVLLGRVSSDGAGHCKGDSGGPIIRMVNDGRQAELVGVVSTRRGPCGQPGTTLIFPKVSKYLDWIQENM